MNNDRLRETRPLGKERLLMLDKCLGFQSKSPVPTEKADYSNTKAW